MGVSISSEAQRKADRKALKEERRMNRKSERKDTQTLQIDQKRLDAQAHVLDDWKKGGSGEERRRGLPEGSVRTVVENKYEQVHSYIYIYICTFSVFLVVCFNPSPLTMHQLNSQVMVPPEIPDPLDRCDRIPITEFSEMSQLAFR